MKDCGSRSHRGRARAAPKRSKFAPVPPCAFARRVAGGDVYEAPAQGGFGRVAVTGCSRV